MILVEGEDEVDGRPKRYSEKVCMRTAEKAVRLDLKW